MLVTWDGAVYLWDAEGRNRLQQFKYNNLLHCGVCSDELLLTGSYDGTIQMWDFERGLFIPQLDID